MPTYRCEGAVNLNGVLYRHGESITLADGSVRDKLLRAGAIWRPDLPPYVYRDRGTMKLVPAKSEGLNRVIYGQSFNGAYVALMSRLGFPCTDQGRRDAIAKWSGLVNVPEFIQHSLDPPLPLAEVADWTVPWYGSWVWVPRSWGTGKSACEELPIP